MVILRWAHQIMVVMIEVIGMFQEVPSDVVEQFGVTLKVRPITESDTPLSCLRPKITP